jgi:23S rRNA (guanosine2251-2'-O)-methyltransferase
MPSLIIIAHNIRSSHNIGAMLRTAEGFGVSEFIMSGYSPYPKSHTDKRLPHIAEKVSRDIHKTALGAEVSLKWSYTDDLAHCLDYLRQKRYGIFAAEQAKDSIPLPQFAPPDKLAVIMGNEVTGVDKEILGKIDGCLEIPMLGKKESYNVASAAAIIMYHCKFGTLSSK